jgi:hypothetical protein
MQVLAQSLPVWYKDHKTDLQKVNYYKFIKNNSVFSLVKIIDTISVPEVVSIVVIDKQGKFSQELNFDTAAYCDSKDLIIAGKKIRGKSFLGVTDLKGTIVIQLSYSKIRFNKNLFALRSQDYFWSLFDNKGNRLTESIYTEMSFTSFGKVVVKNKNGTGILNENGTVLIENIYQDIDQLTADSFMVQEPDSWEHLTVQKQALFKWKADSITALNDSLLLYYSEGRVFVKDSLERTIGSENGYDSAEKFNFNFIKVSLDEYSGLIDLNGKEILPVKYYSIIQDDAGFIKTLGDEIKAGRYGDQINRNKKRWNLYDSLGGKILPKQFKTIRPCREGMIAVQNDENLWGFIDEKIVVIVPKYEYVSDSKNGFLLVKLPGAGINDYRLIDKKENLYFTGTEAQLFYLGVIRYRRCIDSIREGEPETELFYGVPPHRYDYYIPSEFGYIRVKNGPYTGVLAPDGREAVQAYQDTVYSASADTFFLYKRKNGLAGYSDKYCNTAMYLTDQFEHLEPLQDGYSKFKKDGLFGFIDAYGNVHIAPKYTACTEFHNGMAAVFLKGKWGFVDKDENLSVQPYYKEVKHFRNGFAPVKNNSNKWIFIDKNGKPINTTVYDNFRETKNNKYLVVKNKRIGITYSNGKEIFSPKYEYLEEFDTDFIKIKKDGKFGVMDYKENIVLYYQYDDIIYNPFRKNFFVKTKGTKKKIAVVNLKK